jgi:hypothetical protein
LAVAEITSCIEQTQIDHQTTAYRSGDSSARITGNQPVAGQPKGSRDPQNIGEQKALFEIHDVGRKLSVVCPEGDPEKTNGLPLSAASMQGCGRIISQAIPLRRTGKR